MTDTTSADAPVDDATEEQPQGTPAEDTDTGSTPAADVDWKAMSRRHEAEAKANRAAARELAELKAAQQTDAERIAGERDAALERVTKATQRAVRAEVRSVATGLRFRDPGDAMSLLDLSDLTDDDGEVDEAAVKKALADIAKAKPYLLETSTPGRSGGEVKGGTTAGQLTRADLKGMAPKDIEAARKAGRLDNVLGVAAR